MTVHHRLDHEPFVVQPGSKIDLDDYDPGFTAEIKNKSEGRKVLREDVEILAEAQSLLWASAEYAMLIIFQAMDAAGKDGAIKHVMSGVNPQGCNVHSFKAPNEEERLHHFLWRPTRYLPARGRIAIFNRSYYEEVLIVRVHTEFLDHQWLPPRQRGQDLNTMWKNRYIDINSFEHDLSRNGIVILKFFLHVSKEEQRERFLERLNNPEKHWKFNHADIEERGHWDKYMEAYEEMLSETSTEWAPWHIIPADRKWFSRACVADIITAKIETLNLKPPEVSAEEKELLKQAQAELEAEGN